MIREKTIMHKQQKQCDVLISFNNSKQLIVDKSVKKWYNVYCLTIVRLFKIIKGRYINAE